MNEPDATVPFPEVGGTCLECRDGTMPGHYYRRGRADLRCAACGRDVTLILVLIGEAGELAGCQRVDPPGVDGAEGDQVQDQSP